MPIPSEPPCGGHDPGLFPFDLRLRFPATAPAVRTALEEITGGLRGRICAPTLGTLEIVLAEVLNNIVEHAYRGGGAGEIGLSVAADPRMLSCEVCDYGTPLPALLPATEGGGTSVFGPDGALKEGGWGWHIIGRLTRDLTYRRQGGENRLCFALDLCPTPHCRAE